MHDFRSPLPFRFIFIALILLLSSLPAFAATFNASNYAELKAAIDSANANSEADIINITADITFTGNVSDFTTDVTIRGNGRTIDANGNIFFKASGSPHIVIESLVLTGGAGRNSGGAYQSSDSARLTIRDSVFHNNQASSAGGGAISLFTTGATLIEGSAFFNNRSDSVGFVIRQTKTGALTVRNSIFYKNSGQAGAPISEHGGAPVTLDHVVIAFNNGGNMAGYAGGIDNRNPGSPLTMRNSIVWGNTQIDTFGATSYSPHQNCNLNSAPATFTNNIIGGFVPDGAPSSVKVQTAACEAGQSTADPLLPDVGDGTSLIHLIPMSGSPAIDGAPCLPGIRTDLRGTRRPQPSGGRCDIGAYEYAPPPAAEEAGDGDGLPFIPTATPGGQLMAPPPTCLSLPGHISVYNITSGTQCRQVDAAGIGNAEALALGFRDGVDVWGWVLSNTQVCFAGNSGSFRFLDAATSPRAVSELTAYSQNGMVCATIDRAGTVAFLDGPPVSAAEPPASYPQLQNCMVRLQYALNFRAAPGGEVIGAVPVNAVLTAEERAPGWFKVDYHGAKGWISAAYVVTMGICG